MIEETLKSIASSLVTLVEIQSETLNVLRAQYVARATQPPQETEVEEPQVELPGDVGQPVSKPVTAEELESFNNWLIEMTTFLGDDGSMIRGVLAANNLERLSDMAGDRDLLKKVQSEVAALQPKVAA